MCKPNFPTRKKKIMSSFIQHIVFVEQQLCGRDTVENKAEFTHRIYVLVIVLVSKQMITNKYFSSF